MVDFGNRAPGIYSGKTFEPRTVLWDDQAREYLPGGGVVDSAKSRDPGNTNAINTLRPGNLMGKVSASSKYAPSIIGLTGVLHDTSVVTTTMTLPAEVVAEIQRRIGTSGSFKIVGPPTTAGTVASETVAFSAIATATTITITTTSADFAAGSLIMPADGSEAIKGVLDDFVRTTDIDGNNIDASLGRLLISGTIDEEQIVNWSSDASVKTWIKQQLNQPATACGPFKFKGNF